MSDLGRRLAGLSPERRRLVEQRLGDRLGPRDRIEPIAVIGLACRFPGAESAEAFWQLARDGGDAIRPVPPDRWDSEAWERASETSGTRMLREGGFLPDVAAFDAAFFEISPREAESMDPQQRLLLEIAWRAFEDAGVALDALRGSETGVFVGAHSHSTDYARLTFDRLDAVGPFTATGTAQNFLAGRVSYFFDLRGPSLVIDTACSSSLVAVHLACQSLRAGECRSAIAAGVNLILTPHFSLAASHMEMLAPDGRCKPFDARADGFGRGEGCGAVLLKPLSAARADGDRILAVIRGSAVNQDGRTNGITAPNGRAQQLVIERALANAGVTPEQISYVEAHGTGTPLGDPIEAEALVNVLGVNRPAAARCWIGSAKANVGHLEGAAGIAGLIKTVLGLVHGTIPPLAQFTRLSPHVSTGGLLDFPTAAIPWRSRNDRRIAGVSSFGWSGTNAHAIVEEAPAPVLAAEAPTQTDPLIVPLSARTDSALRALAHEYAGRLGDLPSLTDLAWSSATRRTHFEHRLAVVGESPATLRSRLDQFVNTGSAPFVAAGVARSDAVGLAFVFSGQGSQWPAMGEELYATDSAFREAIEACDAAARLFVSWSLVDAIRRASPDRSDTIDVVQPLLFAMAVGLATRWRAWGIEPDAVVGHSMGEIAAAHVAGALTLDDAARIVCVRSALMTRVSGHGGMAVVDLPARDVAARLEALGAAVVIAAHNSPHNTVIAGHGDAVDTLLGHLTAEDIFCRAIRVDVASHCAQVDPLLGPLRAALGSIQPRTSITTIYSTVTGAPVVGEALDADYWVRNLRQPVLFSEAIARLIADGHRRFVEVSPHPILRDAVAECCDGVRDRPLVVGSLERDCAAREVMTASLAALYTDGHDLNWPRVLPHGEFVELPRYPFEPQRFWIVSQSPGAPVSSPAGPRTTLERHSADASKCIFGTSWCEVQPGPAVNCSTRWLIVADETPSAALEAAFKTRGANAAVTGTDDIELVSRAIDTFDPEAVAFVVPPLDLELAAPWKQVESPLLDTAERLAALIKMLARRERPIRLSVVTRNAQAIGIDRHVDPRATALWALARVAWDEYPDCAGVAIDIASDLDRTTALGVVDRLIAPVGRQAAIRGAQCLVPRFTPLRGQVARPISLSSDASYLITGGLAGVGLEIATRLVERGARHLVLASRRGLSEDGAAIDDAGIGAARRAALAALEAKGAKVHAIALDVGDADAIVRALSGLEGVLPPIRGVVHAAATMSFGLLEHTTRDDLSATMRAKAAGAWHLQQYFADRTLDFFVCCSSLGALLGLTGQGSYAAANAFLDGLAHRCRAVGRKWTSINWGVWRHVGSSQSIEGVRASIADMERDGIGGFAPETGLDALEALLEGGSVQASVWAADVDAVRRSARAALEPELFAALALPHIEVPRRDDTGELRRRLQATAPAARRSILEGTVQEELARILRPSPDRVSVSQPLGTLGLESLMALEFHRRIERLLELKLAKTLVWRHPTVETLTEFLLARVFPAAERPSERPAPSLPGDLDTISEEDAMAALLERAPER